MFDSSETMKMELLWGLAEVSSLRVHCRGVVEYDAEGFTKLTLLLMWKDFCFLVHGKKTTEATLCGQRCVIFTRVPICPSQWTSRCTSPGTSPPSPSSLCTTSPTAVSCTLRCRSRILTVLAGTATRWQRGPSE